MATDSVLTTLLENLSINLRDTTNFAGLAGLKNNASYGTRYVQAAFGPLTGKQMGHPTPYAVIVPGSCAKRGAEGRVDEQQVQIHVVHGIFHDPHHYYTTLGTATLDGVLTLCEEIEKALARPRPYGHSPYNTSPYTAQTNVVTGYAVGWTSPEPADLETDSLYLTQVLTMEYRIEKGV